MSSLISRSNLFDDFFKDIAPGFFIKPLQSETLAAPGQIRMDVKETTDAYTIEAEVPGIPKEAIHVSIDGNTVTIKGEVKKEENQSGESFLRSERYYGATSRSLTLPASIDHQKAQAHYDKGVLTLKLPKSSPSSTRELTIQ